VSLKPRRRFYDRWVAPTTPAAAQKTCPSGWHRLRPPTGADAAADRRHPRVRRPPIGRIPGGFASNRGSTARGPRPRLGGQGPLASHWPGHVPPLPEEALICSVVELKRFG
jgi:hypothetical protein